MKKILIIDDEPSLLKILGKFLEKLNYESITAENGDKGLEKFSETPQEFFAVIIDYNLPGSSSKDILAQIKQTNPSIKTVLSTGFSVNEISKEFNVKIDATLQKPFTFADFKQTIEQL